MIINSKPSNLNKIEFVTIVSPKGIKSNGECFQNYIFVIKRIFYRELNSVLGYSIGDKFSFILKPFFLTFLISIVKSLVLDTNLKLNFISVYFGIIIWWFFSESLKKSISIFRRNKSIILKIYLPKYVFIVAMFLSSIAVTFIYIILGFPLFILFEHKISLLGIMYSLFSILLISIFILNISFGISILAIKSRFIRTTTEYLLFSMFFTMPITFNYSDLGHYSLYYLYLNPIGAVIALTNANLMGEIFNYFDCFCSLIIWTLTSLFFIRYFNQNNNVITEKL